MGFSKKTLNANKGRFINDNKGMIFYVDNYEKVWSQDNIADLIAAYRKYSEFSKTADYYKRLL